MCRLKVESCFRLIIWSNRLGLPRCTGILFLMKGGVRYIDLGEMWLTMSVKKNIARNEIRVLYTHWHFSE
ncbi:hypothetical protein AM500_18810 [Bacillus sp. FJAT-18017]|nr:hypothetical protein AM500_18810 [Bacillus sp. FJAT-18017]